jgi:hypothetical protein
MTATSAPFGIRPAYKPGGVITPVRRTLNAASAAAIGKGDPIVMGTDGFIVKATANSGRCDGIFHGCEYIDATGKPQLSPNWPADTGATEVVCWVVEDAEVIYEAQADASLARTDIGSVISFNAGTINALTGLSTADLDVATLATTAGAGKHFLIYDIKPQEDNAFGDAFPIVYVKLALTSFSSSLIAQ